MLKTFFGNDVSIAKVIFRKQDLGYQWFKVDYLRDRGHGESFNVGFDEELLVTNKSERFLLLGPVKTCSIRSVYENGKSCIKQVIFNCFECREITDTCVIEKADQIDRHLSKTNKTEYKPPLTKFYLPKKKIVKRKIHVSHEAMMKRKELLAKQK